MKISTIFEVRKPKSEPEQFEVNDAMGEEACKAIRAENPKRKIMLLGFRVNDKFIPAF